MIEFKIGDEIIEGLMQKALFDIAKNQITNLLDGVTCQVHGDSSIITITKVDEGSGNFDVEIDGCCEEFERVIQKRISGN